MWVFKFELPNIDYQFLKTQRINKAREWKKKRMQYLKKKIQKKKIRRIIQKMMKKTCCTRINLTLRAIVCDGILPSAEDREIKCRIPEAL